MGVEAGYAQWSATYEATVLDEMDLRLLARVTTLAWGRVKRAVDLACGTGRIGTWLRAQGVQRVDGVDTTEAMLASAEAKEAYARLVVADVRETGLESGAYDLAVQVLADEHLAELGPLYVEAARLTTAGGRFVIVGYHPFFLMMGIPTHFDSTEGEPVAIESYVHLASDHVRAATAAGWRLAEMEEGVVDDAWVTKKSKWERYRNRPVSFLMVWEKVS